MSEELLQMIRECGIVKLNAEMLEMLKDFQQECGDVPYIKYSGMDDLIARAEKEAGK